jgi:hypothetical protein
MTQDSQGHSLKDEVRSTLEKVAREVDGFYWQIDSVPEAPGVYDAYCDWTGHDRRCLISYRPIDSAVRIVFNEFEMEPVDKQQLGDFLGAVSRYHFDRQPGKILRAGGGVLVRGVTRSWKGASSPV